MKKLQTTGERPSLACSKGWGLLPFIREYGKWDRSLLECERQGDAQDQLSAHNVPLAFCSPDRLLKNHDLELAYPVGEVYDGPCGLAYFTTENCDLLKQRLAGRMAALKEIFSQSAIRRNDDSRMVANQIWDAVRTLVDPPSKRVPLLFLGSKGGPYTTLARVLYRLLFGAVAYESNERLQGSAGSFQPDRSMELKQGNEALAKRSQYHSVLDLIDLWHELTGMAFVGSVLQKSSRPSIPGSKHHILKAAELAQVRMKVEPSIYLPDIMPLNSLGQGIDLSSIWKHLSYRLIGEDFKSLMLFLNLARPLITKPREDDVFNIKMIRWQERRSLQSLS